jgi:hypothetical protein
MHGVLTSALAGRLARRLYFFGFAKAEAHEDSSTSCCNNMQTIWTPEVLV